MGVAGGSAGRRGGRRQLRAVGGRPHRATVRMTDAEFTALSARATAAGLSLPAWLVAAGLADRTPGSGGGLQITGMSAPERRAWAAEFVAARRLLRGVSTNVNQLAAGFNSTGEVGPQLGAVLDATARVTARLGELTDRLAGRQVLERPARRKASA